MVLEEVIEIIEMTDTDLFSEALESFNEHGIISGASLPFLNVVYETAPNHLCDKLTLIGFKGIVNIQKVVNTGSSEYVVYDSARHSIGDIRSWVED